MKTVIGKWAILGCGAGSSQMKGFRRAPLGKKLGLFKS